MLVPDNIVEFLKNINTELHTNTECKFILIEDGFSITMWLVKNKKLETLLLTLYDDITLGEIREYIELEIKNIKNKNNEIFDHIIKTVPII